MATKIVDTEPEEKILVTIIRCPFCNTLVHYEEREELDVSGKLKFKECPHLLFYYDTVGGLGLIRKGFYELYKRTYGSVEEGFDAEKAAKLFDGIIYRWKESGLACGPVSVTFYMAFSREEQKSEIIDHTGALEE